MSFVYKLQSWSYFGTLECCTGLRKWFVTKQKKNVEKLLKESPQDVNRYQECKTGTNINAE